MNRVEKALGALTLTAVLAGCGGTSAAESQKPSMFSSPTPNPTELVIPSPTPTETVVETPTSTETPELSLEQQAANSAFDYWFALLNTPQKKSDGTNEFYLQASILNPSDWQHNIDLIKKGGISDSSLFVSWVGGEIYPEGSGSSKFQAIKSQGLMSLEQVSFTASSQALTSDDLSKGITNSMLVTLDYKTSYAENEFWPTSDSPYVSLSKAEGWVLTPDQTPFLQATPLNEIQVKDIKVVLENGKWVVDPSKFVSNELGDPLQQVSKPMALMSDTFFCQPSTAGSSCQVIKEKITY